MIKSKERILKHQYNRREFRPIALEIITADITLGEAAKLSVAFPDTFAMGSADVSGQDKMNIRLLGECLDVIEIDEASHIDDSIYNSISKNQEEAIYEELEDKDLLFGYYAGEWTFYEYLRAYHVFEIIIAFLITLGVILWLK